MNDGQLGLLATAAPTLRAPTDLDPAAPWQSCGPAALAAVAGRQLAEIRRHLPHERGYMSPADMQQALESAGFVVACREFAWPTFGVACIFWDGPWSAPGLPPGAALKHSHWIAVSLHDPRGGGECYDVNAERVIYLDFWRRGFAHDLARHLEPRATGGWSLRRSFELTRRA